MPYIIYGLYGRQHFYRYLSMTLLFSVIAFFLYIMFPTSAVLQREEIMSNNIDKHLSNGNVFDKILLKSYTVAAPYGEVPSGHWGCSLLICLGLIKPKTQKKYTKTGLITLIL
ncbi:hypothetical protein FACS189459_3690 [Bacilli bacterium]|nr:hypothetical protein FACS189459_3690 [Bacilli bacterium]